MVRLIGIFLLMALTNISAAQNVSSELPGLTININHNDGGKTSKRHLQTLLDAFKEKIRLSFEFLTLFHFITKVFH